MLTLAQPCGAAPPVVTNVRAAQRAGTELMDVDFDVSASVPPLTGDVGGGLQPGANRHLVWNAGADWDGQFSSQVKFHLIVSDSNAPPGMARIPAFPCALPAVNSVANGRSAKAGLRWNGSGSSRRPCR